MEKHHEENIEFIKTELLPEAVHNRCFCEPESREFIEFDSVVVEPLKLANVNSNDAVKDFYRARLIVNFSGEPRSFNLIIKLLRCDNDNDRAYDSFLNEEMFYSKMTKKYNMNIYPKCYVADMGRYGRPVIVLEDLEACGYVRVDSKLDEDHLDLCLKAIARFHERGFRLKATNFNSFREFYAKLIDTRLDRQSQDLSSEVTNRILDVLRKLKYPGATGIEAEENEALRTICHGNLSSREYFFFKTENGKPVDVKIIVWNQMRYCSIVDDLSEILHDHLGSDIDLEKYLTVYVNACK